MINPSTSPSMYGVRVNYGSFIIPKYRETLIDKTDIPFQQHVDDKYQLPPYSHNKYYEPRRRSKPSQSNRYSMYFYQLSYNRLYLNR